MFVRSLFALTLGLGVLADARASDVPAPAAPLPAQPGSVEIVVEDGYHPDRIVAAEGQAITLTFVRREYTGCTLEVVFPTLGVRRELPPGQPVTIELGPQPAGEIPFHCGMNMIHGAVVVEPRK